MNPNTRWTLIFDADRCNGCNNCTLATRDEYLDNRFPGYAEAMPRHGHPWIDLLSRERGQAPMVDVTYYPVMCQHCEDPPCARGAADAVRKRDDGIVIIDPEASRGRRDMVEACPFGAVWWNEEKEIPQHWNFDAHLIDQGWEAPRCVQACPTEAMTAMRLSAEAFDALLAEGQARRLKPELNLATRVLYKGTRRLETEFVGGTLVRPGAGGEECAAGVEVHLREGTRLVGSAVSDAFGQFKIDGIERAETPRSLKLSVASEAAIERDVTLGESVYLGRIKLAPVSSD